MFTGIDEQLGTVRAVKRGGCWAVLSIGAREILRGLKMGDSVAVNGVCLTVTSLDDGGFTADVMHETLDRSALGSQGTGSRVNLERAMAADGRFGGHIVSGHIDGVGTIIHMSTSYGAQLGLGDTEMMLALLLVQILGLPFCLMYIKLAGKFGARVMVGVGICIYMGICVFGFFVRETWQFWVLAILVATSQGGIQALSRSMFGKMLPDKNRSGEYFGFFDIFGKFSSVMGPALMGFVTQIATVVLLGRQSLTPETAPEAVLAAAQQEASPWGVLSVLLIFLVGAVLYFGVLPRMLKKEGAGK